MEHCLTCDPPRRSDGSLPEVGSLVAVPHFSWDKHGGARACRAESRCRIRRLDGLDGCLGGHDRHRQGLEARDDRTEFWVCYFRDPGDAIRSRI